jgi:hypothetical protein
MPGAGRIPQDVTDISSPDQLLGYATAGQMAQVFRRRPDLSQARIARGARFGRTAADAGAILSAALRKGLTPDQVQRLDEVISTVDAQLEGTGGLSSLALRLGTRKRDDRLFTAQVPMSWTSGLLKSAPVEEVDVLVQASALLQAFRAAETVDPAGRSLADLCGRYAREADLLTRRLIAVSTGPPTPVSYDAQAMLARLANYTFTAMREHLESELRYSPLGFRVWRVITQLVRLKAGGVEDAELRAWVRHLLVDSEEHRRRSLNAGAAFDLELAISVPPAWSPPDNDWASAVLDTRMRNKDATIRERGTAAMGLWQRAIIQGQPAVIRTRDALAELITQFRDPGSRPDAGGGLRWVAATLEQVIEEQVPVCNHWPSIDEPWFRYLQDAAEEISFSSIPEQLEAGTKNLFRHMVMQNASPYRTLATETLVTSGWTEPVASALGRFLRTETEESWIRIRALVALGSLRRPDRVVAEDLTRACQHAYSNLELDEQPTRSSRSEMSAALFAVADCFGVAGAEEPANSVREALRPILTALATAEEPRALMLRRPTRAAAYLLAVTAQHRGSSEKDFSEDLLEQLSHHADPVTARLSRWALNVRFAPDGTTRPMLAAAELGEVGGSPYSA